MEQHLQEWGRVSPFILGVGGSVRFALKSSRQVGGLHMLRNEIDRGAVIGQMDSNQGTS